MDGFIVVGNTNAVTYKEVFPLIKANKVRLGYNTVKTFNTNEGERKFGNVTWFVTYPVEKKPLTLTKTYNPTDYPKYDNYDAVEVSRVKDIPYDYEGTMGVPVTILNYDLDNVEVLGIAAESGEGDCYIRGKETYVDEKHKKSTAMVLNNKRVYARAIIKLVQVGGNTLDKKVFEEYLNQGHKAHYGKSLLIYKKDNKWVMPFNRIMVRRKNYD